MIPKETKINIFLVLLLPFTVAAIFWALSGLDLGQIDDGLITLTALTVFCSTFLRIQLPRVNIHLTISDGLIMLCLLLYGGQAAVLLAVLEMVCGAINMRRKGVTLTAKTLLGNVQFAAISVFAASHVINAVFGSTTAVVSRGDGTSFVWLLVVLSLTLFAINMALVAMFTAIKNERSF